MMYDVNNTLGLVQIAQDLEDRARRIRQVAKETCSHRKALGELVVSPTNPRCYACNAIVSFTIHGEVIYLK